MLTLSSLWSTRALIGSTGGVVSYATYGSGQWESKRYQSHRILQGSCAHVRGCIVSYLQQVCKGTVHTPLQLYGPLAPTRCYFRPERAPTQYLRPRLFTRYIMPRPTSSAFSRNVDGRPNPGSPRWGGAHGSGSNQGQSSDITSRRGVTPASSPRSYPPPPGSGSSRGSSARDQHGLRGTITDISGRNSSGSAGSRGRKSIESDCGGGAREEGGEDSGRIRVAVRVRAYCSPLAFVLIRCKLH